MVKYQETSREDYKEYLVITNEYEGRDLGDAKVGFVTKFSEGKWAFRTIDPFFTDVMPTDKFKTRKEAVETALSSLRAIVREFKNKQEPQEIDLSMLQGQYRRVNNNRKTTRGRKVQYIQRAERLPNGELKYLNSYKKIHHERV